MKHKYTVERLQRTVRPEPGVMIIVTDQYQAEDPQYYRSGDTSILKTETQWQAAYPEKHIISCREDGLGAV